MIGAAESIIFPFLPALCIVLSLFCPFSILFTLESQQYSLVTNKTQSAQIYAHADRHILHSFLVGFHPGSSGGSPISVGCVYMNV